MQIPAAEVARGLQDCISARNSAMFGDSYLFSHFFCVAWLESSFNTARFSDDSRFLCLAYLVGSFIKVFFPFFYENCALRTCAVAMEFGDFRTQNRFFHFFATLSGGFYKSALFHSFCWRKRFGDVWRVMSVL